MTTFGATRTTLLGLSALTLIAGASVPTAGCNAIAGIDLPENDDFRPATGGSGGGGSQASSSAISVVEDGCGAENLEVDERLIAGCMMRTSCDPLTPPYSVSLCVTIAAQTTGATENCTLGATSCEQVWSCLGRTPLDVAGCPAAPTSEGEWVCDGDIATFCSSAFIYSLDCTTLGASCNGERASAYPAMGPCSLADADTYGLPCTGAAAEDAPIDGSDGYFTCSGDVLTFCDGGARYAVNCSSQENVCTDLGDGTAYCSDRPETCTPASDFNCNGTQIEACDAQGYSETYDCGPAGLACEQAGQTIGCVAEGCSITGSCLERCVDETTLQLCQGGSPVTLNCAAYGFAACEELDTDPTIARCTGGNGMLIGDSCEYAHDGECDEGLLCPFGSDTTDCAAYRGTCAFEGDGSCDVPQLCTYGSDVTDCYGLDYTGICCFEDDRCNISESELCLCPDMSWEEDC